MVSTSLRNVIIDNHENTSSRTDPCPALCRPSGAPSYPCILSRADLDLGEAERMPKSQHDHILFYHTVMNPHCIQLGNAVSFTAIAFRKSIMDAMIRTDLGWPYDVSL
jgi:hypothetical protein